jgi:hypothetical protein
MILSPRLTAAALWVVAAPAFAAGNEAAEAEHKRLAEEMRTLAARGAWRGVDASYGKMVLLEKKGVVLTVEDHLLAAQAARDLGNITALYRRLQAAAAAPGGAANSEVENSLKELRASFGEVKLGVDPKFPPGAQLNIAVQPFQADQRNAIAVAQGALTQEGAYAGLLPYGKYTFGPLEFELTPESGLIERYLSPTLAKRGGEGPSELRRNGLRVSLGPQFAWVGQPAEAGLPAGFSRPGLRAGVGFEIELVEHLGLVVETGWHGTFGKAVEGGRTYERALDNGLVQTYSAPEARETLQLFYVWGGPTWFAGDLAISVGPAWGAGRVRASQLAADGATAELGDYAGQVLAGGGALSIFYGLFDTPGMARSRSGLSLSAGTLTDLDRQYPWAQLAFTVAPAN